MNKTICETCQHHRAINNIHERFGKHLPQPAHVCFLRFEENMNFDQRGRPALPIKETAWVEARFDTPEFKPPETCPYLLEHTLQ